MIERILQSVSWLVIAYITTLSFLGIQSFLTTWEKIEQENTVQAVLITSNPKAYKNVKDSIFSAYLRRMK